MILMEVREATPNPIYDGRKRQGCESIKTFEQGMRFTLAGTGSLTVNLFAASGIGTTSCTDNALVVALLAAAKPVKAETYAEIAATTQGGHVAADELIDAAIADGLLSEGQVRTLIQHVLDERKEADAPPPPPPAAPKPTPTPSPAPANDKGGAGKGNSAAATKPAAAS